MQRVIQLTADGSHTILLPDQKISYHSEHGAIGESRVVFIEACLIPLIETMKNSPLNIFEMGFGTGLNALLSLKEAIRNNRLIRYTSIENDPLKESVTNQLNYGEILHLETEFRHMHACTWDTDIQIQPLFILHKQHKSLLEIREIRAYDGIFFDAFSPGDQPELWTETIFRNMYHALQPNGILTTYCSKSMVRKAMVSAGFLVEKIPGPWGKREMVRARKPSPNP